MRLILFLSMISILLQACSSAVLFQDDFTHTLTDNWSVLLPINYTQSGGQVSFSANPVHRVIDPPSPFGQSSASLGAWMPTSLMTGIPVAPNETVRVTVRSSFKRYKSTRQPFGNLVTNPTDDPRLGTCGFLVQHPDSLTTACAFHSNNWIWNWHDRFAYANSGNVNFQTGQVYPSSYKGFVSWKKASRSKCGGDKIVIEYDRLKQEFRWYVNDVLTRKSTNPGGWPQVDGKDVALYQHVLSPSTSKVDLPYLTVTFACVTEMDKVDPFNPSSTKGLVNHNQPDYVYNLPSSWFSGDSNSANDAQYQAFGQSLEYNLSGVKIERFPSRV